MSNLVEIEGVSLYYGNFKALNQISLELEPGKIIGLLGPNGSGKTTLIKLMNGLLYTNHGKIRIDGNEVGVKTKAVVSYLPERTYLEPTQRVSDAIEFFKDFYKDFNEKKALELLNKFNIDIKQKFENLSKGMKEKVQLILVMSREARLYVLDEPIAGVDPASRDVILDLIVNNFNPDSTIIISTHLIHDIERILDDVIFLNQGNVLLHDSADNIRQKYGESIDTAFREVFKCLANY